MAEAADGDERVMATAQQIVKNLGTSENAKDDMILILSSFDNRLSSITDLLSAAAGISGPENRLDAAERVISRWGDSSTAGSTRGFIPWEESPAEASGYLAAVDVVIALTEQGEGEREVAHEGVEVLDRAERVLQMAMDRLEDEFRHIVVQNAVPLDAARLYGSIRRMSLSFASDGGESCDELVGWEEEQEASPEQIRTPTRGGCGGSLSRELLGVDLVRPEAVPHLKSIAERMIRSGYERECCQAYIGVRRELLDESLAILGVEKISIEEVQRIEWKDLDEKMKKWAYALKVVVQGLLRGEKHLCDQIFEVSPAIAEVCFIETGKGCVMQMLNFAEAVAIGQRSPEKLFRILDMYDALSSVMPDLQLQFAEEERGFLCGEAEIILQRLGDAARGTLAEFENAVQRETSRKVMQFGDIHPLTRYVMNYVKLLVDYSGTLDELLGEISPAEAQESRHGDDEDQFAGTMSPLGRRVLSTVSCLESNIEEKSRLYDDSGMQYVFLMNNIHYMVQKVKDSELGVVLGDEWVRKRRGQIRQHARSYLRASWTRVVGCLKDEGIGFVGGSSGGASRAALKDRFKNFNGVFEEVYRNQMAWKVPDPQLREELRISVSETVIPAYRSFIGRFGGQLEGGRNAAKYVKYTPEDLEKYTLDLFQGLSGPSSHSSRKKLS